MDDKIRIEKHEIANLILKINKLGMDIERNQRQAASLENLISNAKVEKDQLRQQLDNLITENGFASANNAGCPHVAANEAETNHSTAHSADAADAATAEAATHRYHHLTLAQSSTHFCEALACLNVPANKAEANNYVAVDGGNCADAIKSSAGDCPDGPTNKQEVKNATIETGANAAATAAVTAYASPDAIPNTQTSTDADAATIAAANAIEDDVEYPEDPTDLLANKPTNWPFGFLLEVSAKDGPIEPALKKQCKL